MQRSSSNIIFLCFPLAQCTEKKIFFFNELKKTYFIYVSFSHREEEAGGKYF